MIESGRILADLIGPILLSMFHLGVKALKKSSNISKKCSTIIS